MKKALSVLIFTIVFGVGGGILRAYQLENAYDSSGLPIVAHPVSIALVVISAVFLCLLAAILFTVRTRNNESDSKKLMSMDIAGFLTGILGGAALTAAGIFLFISSSTTLDSALGVFAFAGGICEIWAIVKCRQGHGAKGAGALIVLVLFIAFWLVCNFREYGGTDAVLQNYAYIILAAVCCVLGPYFFTGFAFGFSKPALLSFFSMAGIYFCGISLADQTSIGGFLLFGSFILFLGSASFTVLKNLYLSETDTNIQESDE